MKRITVVRHAKSSWDHPGLADRDRPLNSRGLSDAPLMGKVCLEHLPVPDSIVCSPARRARQTMDLLLEGWNLSEHNIRSDERIYQAGLTQLLELIDDTLQRARHVLLCGHMPGVGVLASWLHAGFSDDVPTATVMSFIMEGDRLQKDCASMEFYGIPRAFRNS